MKLDNLSVTESKLLLEKGDVSSVELTNLYLDRIVKNDPSLGAFLNVTKDQALDQAKESDKRRAAKNLKGQLDGIPGALKDIFTTKNVETTAASKILERFKPPYDAFATKLMEDAGMVLLGKTNLDEFAMGSSTEYSAYKTTHNPWDKSRVPGGSSGGSAVAVAADLCAFALGTDTGGSIRQPAGWTGVVGLKPTYGRVSRNGIMAMASSLDQVGVFTKSVEDAALLLSILSEKDEWDSTHAGKASEDYQSHFSKSLSGVKIGVINEFFDKGLDSGVQKTVQTAINELEKLGAQVKPVSLSLLKYALAVYYIIVPAEVSTNLERYDGIKYGFSAISDDANQTLATVYGQSRDAGLGVEAKRRSMLGAFVLSAGHHDAFYTQAQKVRALICQQFTTVFADVDVLVGPCSPTAPFKIGQNMDDPLKMMMADIMLVPANIAGLPALSVPAGFNDGLPVGLQILADQFKEEKMLKVAYAFEQATLWHNKHPNL